MDLSSAISNALPIFAYFLIPLFMIIGIGIVKLPWFKGVIGEFFVNIAIKFFLDKQEYQLFKNVMLPTEDGSTQIDHIVISKYGIFVIETKNMKGWIFGSAHQKQWTQKIYKHTSKFQNPLHQNYKHTQILSSCLGVDESILFSVVVFVGDNTFKTEMPNNVTYASGLIRFIKSKTTQILSGTEISQSIDKIKSDRLDTTFKNHRAHVKHVQEIKKKKSAEKRCPKCGSQMVLRTAKKGSSAGSKFWGCTQFPKCKIVIK